MNNLSRNYELNPLKHYELPCKEDLEYLYLQCGWSCEQLATFFKKSRTTIRKARLQYGLLRTRTEIIELSRKTMFKRYGVENPFASKEVQEKIRQTNLEKYGVQYPQQNSEILKKSNTTNLKKYGVIRPSQNKEIKEQIKQTNLKNFGTPCSLQNKFIQEKRKQTFLEKYGVENPFANKEIQERIKQTNLRKFGVACVSQNPEVKKKLSLTLSSKEVLNKQYNTKKRNHSFNISNPENLIYERLSEKFGEVLRQYKSEKYPFSCDFYIPEIDLYIEFQGTWTHGKRPYDANNPQCQEKLEKWKAKNKKYYENAIYVWTDLDVRKRKIAKENNLNWLEFFTIQEFEEFISKILIQDISTNS